MEAKRVDELLGSYKQNKARYNHLYIDAMNMVMQINDETRKALAADATHAQQYKDTPGGGRVSKPVEDLAIRYMDGYLPDVLQGWLAESSEMQRELRELETNIAYVDTWLGALAGKELAVVTDHMVEGHSLRELEITSARRYGYHMTADGIRGIKRRAMQKIYAIAR